MRTFSTSSPPRILRSSDDDVITVTGLVKSYGGRRVVDDVDLAVRRGEIFGLLGPNGAGKTTTVECLQGLRRPDAGSVRVLGHDPVADHAALRTLVGSQLQESGLPDRLRVGEAVALFDHSGRHDPSAHLEPWGLAEQRSTAFGDLSGGQRQRLFIVLALLGQPEIVFLDELAQGLDPSARREVWRAVEHVRNQGTTVVLVSHFAEEVERLCDRVAVMQHGRIVDVATPHDLIDRHTSSTTITCTPPAGTHDATLASLADVRSVDRAGGRMVVTGSSAMLAPVCAALLGADGAGPTDLRVAHATLDDAVIELLGAPR